MVALSSLLSSSMFNSFNASVAKTGRVQLFWFWCVFTHAPDFRAGVSTIDWILTHTSKHTHVPKADIRTSTPAPQLKIR